MNWVGGARSRIKQQGERRTQKEFFERRRLMRRTRHPPSPGDGRSKTVISQDLLLLQTLAHAHNVKQTEREVPRAVQAVNLDAKKPPFQQKMDLELPMSPIEKPSFLDLMDTSTVSFYHDLPRISTEKLPHLSTSGASGVTSSKVRSRGPDPSVMTLAAAHKPAPSLQPGGPSPLHVLQHHLKSPERNKPLARRQKLDSEAPLKPKGTTSLYIRPPPPSHTRPPHIPLEDKNKLLTFQRSQMLDTNQQNVAQDSAVTSGCDFSGWKSGYFQHKKTNTTSPEHCLQDHKKKQYHTEDRLQQPAEGALGGARCEEDGEGHRTSDDTTFNESILHPLMKRIPQRHATEAVAPPTKQHLGVQAPPMSTFEKMVMFFEKAGGVPEVRLCQGEEHSMGGCHDDWRAFACKGLAGLCQGEEHSVGGCHDDWRAFACKGLAGQDQGHSALVSNNLTMMTEQPIPSDPTKNQENNIPRVKKKLDLTYSRLKNASVLDEIMCLEHELSHSVDGDVQASQEVTFPLEASEDPIGHGGHVPNPKVSAAGCKGEEQVWGGGVRLTADGEQEHLEKDKVPTKTSLHGLQPPPTTDGGTLTDPVPYKDVSCGCDLRSGSPRDPPLQSGTSAQIEACVGSQRQSRVQRAETPPVPRNIPGANHCQSAVLHRCGDTDRCGVQMEDAWVQACDPPLQTLHVQLSALKQELAVAQSTIVWQSVMLRCLQCE